MSDKRRELEPPRGWYSRGYLPHFDSPGLVQMITFRLYDSLPRSVIEALESERPPITGAAWRSRIESYLDAGYGSCRLCEPGIAHVLEDVLLYFDARRYRLLAWVIMPNHVHVLIETMSDFPLAAVVHSWKSFSAKQINKLLGQTGPFWQREYFDRYIRDDTHFEAAVRYIHENPVKAGLVDRAEAWPAARRNHKTSWSAGVPPAESAKKKRSKPRRKKLVEVARPLGTINAGRLTTKGSVRLSHRYS